jgi:ferredoxin
MLVQLVVDPNACIGSGECVALEPEAIELDSQGIAEVIVPELDEARATAVCDSCPVGAISIAAL